MKLTKFQIQVLLRLYRPYSEYESHHPRDAYRANTIDLLKISGYVETYFYRNFLHSAVRLTEKGIEKVIRLNEEVLA